MVLADVNRGDKFKIVDIPDDIVRVQALRFGITGGARLTCGEKIPGGPVVVQRNLQEIAIGRNLAGKIEIKQEEGI